ncbi:hypothetical protein niasHS_004145 [Heterodera schachtii]|uniref:Uncharacterized protein n=1 Tax=Heterodera schachtii TaxID=97005 RepID=A0ABD2JKS4_HETSC
MVAQFSSSKILRAIFGLVFIIIIISETLLFSGVEAGDTEKETVKIKAYCKGNASDPIPIYANARQQLHNCTLLWYNKTELKREKAGTYCEFTFVGNNHSYTKSDGETIACKDYEDKEDKPLEKLLIVFNDAEKALDKYVRGKEVEKKGKEFGNDGENSGSEKAKEK